MELDRLMDGLTGGQHHIERILIVHRRQRELSTILVNQVQLEAFAGEPSPQFLIPAGEMPEKRVNGFEVRSGSVDLIHGEASRIRTHLLSNRDWICIGTFDQ